MGVFIRKDSPFYWLHLERKRQRGKKESTRVLVSTGSKEADEANRLEAQKIYVRRMNELVRDDARRDGHRPTQVGKSGSASTRTSLLLSDALKTALDALKARDGISESEAMRRAIAEYLERKGIPVGNYEREKRSSGMESLRTT